MNTYILGNSEHVPPRLLDMKIYVFPGSRAQ
jgi:hypothetical protein